MPRRKVSRHRRSDSRFAKPNAAKSDSNRRSICGSIPYKLIDEFESAAKERFGDGVIVCVLSQAWFKPTDGTTLEDAKRFTEEWVASH